MASRRRPRRVGAAVGPERPRPRGRRGPARRRGGAAARVADRGAPRGALPGPRPARGPAARRAAVVWCVSEVLFCGFGLAGGGLGSGHGEAYGDSDSRGDPRRPPHGPAARRVLRVLDHEARLEVDVEPAVDRAGAVARTLSTATNAPPHTFTCATAAAAPRAVPPASRGFDGFYRSVHGRNGSACHRSAKRENRCLISRA